MGLLRELVSCADPVHSRVVNPARLHPARGITPVTGAKGAHLPKHIPENAKGWCLAEAKPATARRKKNKGGANGLKGIGFWDISQKTPFDNPWRGLPMPTHTHAWAGVSRLAREGKPGLGWPASKGWPAVGWSGSSALLALCWLAADSKAEFADDFLNDGLFLFRGQLADQSAR